MYNSQHIIDKEGLSGDHLRTTAGINIKDKFSKRAQAESKKAQQQQQK
tara:strand:- start:1171 stop:1314 length:144 start_codon:yes stop_codon:yes gene_type:complete